MPWKRQILALPSSYPLLGKAAVCTVCFLKLNVLMELSLRHIEGISLNIDLALAFLIILMLRFAIITWYLQISQTTLFL